MGTGLARHAEITGKDRKTSKADAVNDAELLALVLKHRAEQIHLAAIAGIEANRAINRARSDGR